MERYSRWRDPGTGTAPLLAPVSPTTSPVASALCLPLAAIRTLVLLLVFLLHALLHALISPALVIPPLHRALARAVTTVTVRVAMLVLGFVWIKSEDVTLRKASRSGVQAPFAPGKGSIIIANSSSPIDVLYLAFFCNPTFLLPISSTGSKASSTSAAKITSFRRVGLLSMLSSSGRTPERSERGETLEQAALAAPGALVFFPECTSSNNRALLKFAEVQDTRSKTTASLQSFVLSFKYEIPSAISPSVAQPIPSSVLNPLPHLFAICTSPVFRRLTVRRLQPTEAPTLSVNPSRNELDALAELLAATGRWKRTAIDWEAKVEFEQFRTKKR